MERSCQKAGNDRWYRQQQRPNSQEFHRVVQVVVQQIIVRT